MTHKSEVAIRYTMAFLFLWFGSQQVFHPGSWTAFLPSFTGYLPIPAEMLIQLNGWFEVIGSLLLLLGAGTRLMAFLLGAHLMGIAVSVGGAIGVRDAALAAVSLALSLSPADALTMDARFGKTKSAHAKSAVVV